MISFWRIPDECTQEFGNKWISAVFDNLLISIQSVYPNSLTRWFYSVGESNTMELIMIYHTLVYQQNCLKMDSHLIFSLLWPGSLASPTEQRNRLLSFPSPELAGRYSVATIVFILLLISIINRRGCLLRVAHNSIINISEGNKTTTTQSCLR